eukprot:1094460-Pyramimonas_sp.AAC.1
MPHVGTGWKCAWTFEGGAPGCSTPSPASAPSSPGPPMGYHQRPGDKGLPLPPIRPRMGYHPRPGRK